MINPTIFKAYDIRGIYPTDIDETGYETVIKAIITFLKNKLKKENLVLAIGRDVRLSTPKFFEVAKKACIESGITGVDIGLTSTPTFYFGTLKYGYDAGIMITASHNPKEYNGVKIAIRDQEKLIKVGAGSGMETIKELALKNKFSVAKKRGKIISNQHVLDDEIKNALKYLDSKKIKKFKIVTDTANGMAILYLNKFFEKIPCNVIRIFDQLDGTFPNHEGNPLKFETLKWLQEKVVQEKADFGIAPDADGDRIFFVDEKGQIVRATMITSIIAEEVLKTSPGETIVVDIRYVRNAAKVIENHGGKMALTKVGHAFITQKLTEVSGVFAGESSGHFFFRQTGFAESSVLVLAYLLKILSEKKQPLSEIVKKFYTSFESGEFNFTLTGNFSGQEMQKKIAADYPDAQISLLDGVTVEYPTWRFNIRSSNTEPLLRLNIESNSESLTQEKIKELSAKIITLGGIPKS
jgi:phosphomannomutase